MPSTLLDTINWIELTISCFCFFKAASEQVKATYVGCLRTVFRSFRSRIACRLSLRDVLFLALFLYVAIPKCYSSITTSTSERLKLSFPMRWSYDCSYYVIPFIKSLLWHGYFSYFSVCSDWFWRGGYGLIQGCLSKVCIILSKCDTVKHS